MHAIRPPQLAPVLRPTPAAAFWWVVVGVGAVVYGIGFLGLDATELRDIDAAFWMLLAFVVLGELRPVVASARPDPHGVILGTAFVFATLLLWGLAPALLAVLLSTSVGELSRRQPVYRALFNLAQYAVSYLAAWGVLVFAGWSATASAPAVLTPVDLGPILLAAGTYHLVNTVTVGTIRGLFDGRRVWTAIGTDLGWNTVTTGAVLAISPLVAVVVSVHWGFLPLLLLPLSLLWATASLALERERRGLIDDLTGLANRTGLARRVSSLVADGAGGGSAVVCLIDLDRFKEVNDTLGHTVGDRLLQAVAGRLRGTCRDSDLVARLGGDEFVLLLSVDPVETAATVVQRISDVLREPFEVGGVRLEIETSAGVALLPDHGRDLETLLRRADVAMYEAKARAEAVVVFERSLEQRTPVRSALLSELRVGLREGQLGLWYQPQVALPGGELLGVEALLRWQHPTRGLLLPAAYLPLVERTAAMRDVTAMVLDLALEQLAAWEGAGRAVPIAINASLHDLADGRFAQRVTQGLASHDVRPDLLRVEITEQALVSEPARVLATLTALRELGVGLGLDDFGTGHASLTRLKRLPVDEVKIDSAFVGDLGSSRAADQAIVRAVIELARACGLRTIAEGVESPAQREVLTALGCDAIQGWLVAAAMPAEELDRWRQEQELLLPRIGWGSHGR